MANSGPTERHIKPYVDVELDRCPAFYGKREGLFLTISADRQPEPLGTFSGVFAEVAYDDGYRLCFHNKPETSPNNGILEVLTKIKDNLKFQDFVNETITLQELLGINTFPVSKRIYIRNLGNCKTKRENQSVRMKKDNKGCCLYNHHRVRDEEQEP